MKNSRNPFAMHGDPHNPLETSNAETAVAAFINGRINFERLSTEKYGLVDFKLERMRSLLARLGDPQQEIPAVHLAGTKGKGSTAAMIAAMLQTSGRRVGLFTSPHIEHFSERMTVDAQRPTPGQLIGLLEQLQPVIEEMDHLGHQMRPTFFEVLTAMAWLHFRQQNIDVVVLETGLGGRLDATNVCVPRLCVITSISRDHERLLGSTLAQIAGEKAGIIKSQVPVISGVVEGESRDIIRNVAMQQTARIFELSESIRWTESESPSSSAPVKVGPRHLRVDVSTPWRSHDTLTVPLPGRHQANNLALAVAAVDCLNDDGWDIPTSAIRQGLEEVHWPLRVEVIREQPLVIVDAAHNVASIDALIETLATVKARKRLLVFSTAKDKDTAGMLSRLSGVFDRVVITQFVDNPRATPRETLEPLAGELLSVPWSWSESPTEAWNAARQETRSDDLICATGSFFLAAEFCKVVRASAP